VGGGHHRQSLHSSLHNIPKPTIYSHDREVSHLYIVQHHHQSFNHPSLNGCAFVTAYSSATGWEKVFLFFGQRTPKTTN